MALTKGQKKRRRAEMDEAERVTDPARIAELLESRFSNATCAILVRRHELWPHVREWWIANHRTWAQWESMFDRTMLLLEIIKNPTLTDEDLSQDVFVHYVTDKVLEHENCGDKALEAVAHAWRQDTIGFGNPDFFGSMDVVQCFSKKQWHRLFALVGKKNLPPWLEGKGPYYHPGEVARRKLAADLDKFLSS